MDMFFVILSEQRKQPLNCNSGLVECLQFMSYNNENRAMLHKYSKMKDPYYQKDLGSVWEAAFDELTDAASRLMMLVCLLAPADIPEHIFSEGEKPPPPRIQFLKSYRSVSKAIQPAFCVANRLEL